MSSGDSPAPHLVCSPSVPSAEAVRFDPSWRTSTVIALAEGIRREDTFETMPILADALEDAGCDNQLLLEHCRHANSHWFSCWVLTLILEEVPPKITPHAAEPTIFAEASSRFFVLAESTASERQKVSLVVRFFFPVFGFIFLFDRFVFSLIDLYRKQDLLGIVAVVVLSILCLSILYLGVCSFVILNRWRKRNSPPTL